MPKKTNREVGVTNILIKKKVGAAFFRKLGINPKKQNRIDVKKALFKLYSLKQPDLSVTPRLTLAEQRPDNAYGVPLTKREHKIFMRLFNFAADDSFSKISHKIEEDVLNKRITINRSSFTNRDKIKSGLFKKVIFLNIGWMKKYQGIYADKIAGGGSFVEKKGYGHEIFNFLPYNGYMYGYVQPKDSININRLGANINDNSIDNILAVWVSKARIIGWYDNATVYRKWQPAPAGSNRKYKKETLGYYIKAKEENYKLLSLDERIFRIPRGRMGGGMGQSNVWYADDATHVPFKQRVLDYIEKGKIPEKIKKIGMKSKRPFQTDPYKRQKIEKAAVAITATHYEKLGYKVTSFEKDNVGWDLEAINNMNLLRLEVKGLSQDEIFIEMTSNEYENMKKYKDSYRICAVTNALKRHPLLSIFSYSPESNKWEDEEGKPLNIVEVISARMQLE